MGERTEQQAELLRSILEQVDQNRLCGACHVCCSYVTIEELGKGAGIDCSNLSSHGCGIYQERPDVCRFFHCVWKFGWGEEEDRPDLSGILLVGPKNPEAIWFGDVCIGSKRFAPAIERLVRERRPFGIRTASIVAGPRAAIVQLFDQIRNPRTLRVCASWMRRIDLERLGDDEIIAAFEAEGIGREP